MKIPNSAYISIAFFFLFGILSVCLNSCKEAGANEEANIISKEKFIEGCLQELANSDFNEFEKTDACVCNHDYMYTKYGETAYDNTANTEFEDSVEKLLCYIKVYKRKMRNFERGA